MNMIQNLLQIFSTSSGFPVSVINKDGQILLSVNKVNETPFYKIRDVDSFQKEIISTGQLISKSTIFSWHEETLNLKFILSPIISSTKTNYLLVAGPFLEESKKNDLVDLSMTSVNQEEKTELVNKIDSITFMIKSFEENEKRTQVQRKIIDILTHIRQSKGNLIENDQFLSHLFAQILQLNRIDFIGLSEKIDHAKFMIKAVQGQSIEQLKGNTFYIGEGLLGKAVVLGENMFLSDTGLTNRSDFFQQFHLYPNQLFIFPIKKNGIVEGLMFGGTTEDRMISQELLDILQFIVHLYSERKASDEALKHEKHLQLAFYGLLDLLEVALHTEDVKNIMYKVLDFCQSINNHHFSSFTVDNGETISRGALNDPLLEEHKKVCHELIREGSNLQQLKRIYEQSMVFHQPIFVEKNCIGMLTVELKDRKKNEEVSMSLHIIARLLSRCIKMEQHNDEELDHNHLETINLLHDSLEELNKQNYLNTLEAMKIVKKLSQSLSIPETSVEQLMNACKVMTYRLEFLKSKLKNSKVLHLLEESMDVSTKQVNKSIEVKMITYIYQTIVKRIDKNLALSFLDDEMKMAIQQVSPDLETRMEENHSSSLKQAEEMELADEQINDLVDIKSVILELKLTSREKEILFLILEGLNNQEVGSYLNISVHTVKNHITNIFKKLNVTDRVQAMAKIYRIKYGME